MRELGMALLGTMVIALFFGFKIYPDLEYTGGSSNTSCTGECYEQYVAQYGKPAEIEAKKQELAAGDPFSDIRSLWAGCAACHGQQGQGMGMFPQLAGKSSDYIVDRLTTYKNRGQVGMNSSMMWGQAANLSEKDIETIGQFIQEGFPSK